MRANELAHLAGISVRTLHHYDQIGLLCPKRKNENGYRDYADTDVDRLQQILFFRACGFKLEEIARILTCSDYDALEALKLQRKSLLHQREQLNTLLQTVNQTIASMEGDYVMSQEEKFVGFDFSKNPYEAEARERWGDEAVTRSNHYVQQLSKQEQGALGDEMQTQLRALAALRHLPVDDASVQETVASYCAFLSRFYPYSPEALEGLGAMYVEDARFQKNIDQFGAGTAEFLAKAMKHYAQTLRDA